MKKQWTAFLAMLILSSSMTGCGSKEDVKVPPVQEELTETTEAETPVETAMADEKASEEIKEETDKPAETETADKEETKKEEVKAEAEKAPAPSTTPVAEKKEETAKAPATNNVPAAKPNSNSSSASANASTTKPSAAPQTPAPSNKPVPSPTPEVPAEKPVAQTSLSCSQLFSSITSGIEFGMMMDANSDLLRDFYNIDSSLLEDYCVKMPQMSFQITEIGVFKVKDANNVSSVVAGIEQRADNVGISLYPSLQETYDSRVIITKGNYILFAMAEDAAAIADQFNSLVK